jgi:hypothetical protein
MWQVVHNTNITAAIYFVEFSMVELDAELHTEYGCLDTMFPGKL